METEKTNKKVLMIGSVWPEPDSSAAGVREWERINLFLDHRNPNPWQVLYASASRSNSYRNQLESSGIKTFALQLNHSSFDRWIAEEKPDFAFYDRFITEEQYGWRLRESSPDTIEILDTQDLHFLRKHRQRLILKGGDQACTKIFRGELDFVSDLKSKSEIYRELASIYRVDLSFILSTFELELLQDFWHISKDSLFWFPFCSSKSSHILYQEDGNFSIRKNFIHLGNYRHPPNADGILWLKQKIWPKVREALPHAEVHLYGAYPTREIMQLDQPQEGFRVKGPIKSQADSPLDSLEETFLKYRVNLAPLRFGAGIKGKIVQGWKAGTPVVTTPIGAEGMGSMNINWGGRIACSAVEFISEAIHLYSDSECWHQSQRAGAELYHSLFNFDLHFQRFHQKLKDLELKKKRKLDQIGSYFDLIRYHSHQSVKNFSKRIEEKNSISRTRI